MNIDYLALFSRGTAMTMSLMISSLIIGFILAILLTFARQSHHRIVRAPVEVFIFVIKGTPLLVQIFLIYYGFAEFEFLRDTIIWDILKRPFACAVIALSLNSAAYSAEIFSGAIKSVPYGEIEACLALGMPKALMLRRIILPRALQLALPAYSNEVIYVLKATSLASVITLLDIIGTARHIIAQTYSTMHVFLISGCIYFIINYTITQIFKALERRAVV